MHVTTSSFEKIGISENFILLFEVWCYWQPICFESWNLTQNTWKHLVCRGHCWFSEKISRKQPFFWIFLPSCCFWRKFPKTGQKRYEISQRIWGRAEKICRISVHLTKKKYLCQAAGNMKWLEVLKHQKVDN